MDQVHSNRITGKLQLITNWFSFLVLITFKKHNQSDDQTDWKQTEGLAGDLFWRKKQTVKLLHKLSIVNIDRTSWERHER